MSLYTHTINVDASSLEAALRDGLRLWNPNSWRVEVTPGYYKPTLPPTPAQRLANEAAQLVKDGHDVSAVTRAIATIESERRAIAEKALQGALDLAKAKPAKAQRFRLVFHDERKGVVLMEGIMFPDERDDKSKEPLGTYVFLAPVPAGVGASLPARSYTSMKKLRESLDEHKIIHRIDYID